MKRIVFLYCILLLSFQNSLAQSSEGTSFWLSYMENLNLAFNDFPSFAIYVDAEATTNVTLEVPATGLQLSFTAAANEMTEFRLPEAIWYSERSENIDNKGIHITSDLPIKVHAFHYRRFFSESTSLLTEAALGSEYLITAYMDDLGEDPSSLVITSTADNNEIEITPSTLTAGLRPADIPFTITLQRGQNYQIQARGDLTGTRIRSLNNQKIAVFAGARQGNVSTCSADSHIFDQISPIDLWKTDYYCVPFAGQGGDIFKIIALEDSTAIFVDCEQLGIYQAAQPDIIRLTEPTVIRASRKINVVQLNEGGDCNPSGLGDPNMLQLLPIQYQGQQFRFFADGRTNPSGGERYFTRHFINIVSSSENAGSISLDGNTGLNFSPFPGDNAFVYAQVQVDPGPHIVESDRDFQAYSYGFGSFDAYTNNLGFEKILDNEQRLAGCLNISVENLLCSGALLDFTYQTNYKPILWEWDFGDGNTSSSPLPEHTYESAGNYTVRLRITDSLERVLEEQLNITVISCNSAPCTNAPDIDFSFMDKNCINDPVSFSATSDRPLKSIRWFFGNSQEAVGENVTTTYDELGTFEVFIEATDSINCVYTFLDTIEIVNCQPCEDFTDLELQIEGSTCIDSTIIISAPLDTVNQPLIEFEWFINDEFIINDFALTLLLESSNPVEVVFRGKDIFGCEYFGVTFINPADCSSGDCTRLPPVDIAVNGEACLNTDLLFLLRTAANLVTFEWETNTGVSGNQPTLPLTPNRVGVLEVLFTGTDAQGCTYNQGIGLDISDCEGEECNILPPLSIQVDGEAIVGGNIFVSLPEAEDLSNISWTTNTEFSSTESSFDYQILETGLLTISVSAVQISNGCPRSGSITLEILELDVCTVLPFLDIEGPDQVSCLSEENFSIQTDATIMDVRWIFDRDTLGIDTILTFIGEEEKTAELLLEIIDDNGCLWTASKTVSIVDCNCTIGFPNAFTPNNDQVNDCFAPVYTTGCIFNFFKMQIFTRWGQKIFESNDINNCWDGTFNGRALPSDVFVYMIEYQFNNQSSIALESGDILLVR